MPNGVRVRATNRARVERHQLYEARDRADEDSNVFRARSEERADARRLARLEAYWGSSIQLRRPPCPARGLR